MVNNTLVRKNNNHASIDCAIVGFCYNLFIVALPKHDIIINGLFRSCSVIVVKVDEKKSNVAQKHLIEIALI
jgi:hypothetical protein